LLASSYTDSGTVANLKFSFAAARNHITAGGWGREVTVRELPTATTLAGVNMRLKPGGIREMHWHTEAEWAYMIAGRCRITVVDAEGRNFIDDIGPGDLWNFPAGIPHSIQGLEQGCEFLLVFDDGNFSENETFLLSDWFVHTPREVLAKNFGVPEQSFDGLPTDIEHTRWIFAGKVPPAAQIRCSQIAGWTDADQLQLSSIAAGADQDAKRSGSHRGLVEFSGGEPDRGDAGRGQSRRHARDALAPQCRRMAVLPERQRANDRVLAR
jgi:oxalate decarboxylase family bicupin protein